MKLFSSLFALCVTATIANAQTCDPSAAEVKLNAAETAGALKGYGFFNDIPTMAVDSATWEHMTLDPRMGMIETFECAVAGEGNILAKIQIVDEQGRVLATFDGVTRKADFKH